jgi:ParB-like chromosome segregation protein Spo0J
MEGIVIEQKEVEIGQLELRFAHTRLKRPAALAAMTASLERYGQTSPVVIVGESPMVLVDGYLRVAALSRLGRDTVMAEQWSCDEAESLIRILLRKQDRRWEAIEEAWLIRELRERYRFPQDKVAALLGRHQSWVSRRLLLLESLPEDILEAVRQGVVSTWSAARVLAPMARAMPEHARSLAASLGKEHLGTRDLALLWKHYQGANRKQREKMVEAPAMFVKAWRGREEEREASAVRLGADGRWFNDLRVAGHMLTRLRRNAAQVVHPDMGNLERRAVRTGFAELTEAFTALRETIDLRCADVSERDRGCDSGLEGAGSGDQTDLPVVEDLSQCGAPGDSGTIRTTAVGQPRTMAPGARGLRGLQGQCDAAT